MDGQPTISRRRRWALGGVVVLLAGGVVACAPPGYHPPVATSTTYPNAPRHRPVPGWLDQVCPGLVAGRDAPAQAFAGLDPSGVQGDAAARTKLRTAVVAHLEAQAKVLERADRQLADAGDPDTRAGNELRDALRLGLAGARDQFRLVARQAATAPIGDADRFGKAITAALGSLERSTADLVTAIAALHDDPTIAASLPKHAACQGL